MVTSGKAQTASHGASPDAPLMRLIRRGPFARAECSDINCTDLRTVRCNYSDRFGQRCTTALCGQHLHAYKRKAYCPAHIVSVTPASHGNHLIAMSLDWLARAIDDDIIAVLSETAAQLGENVRSDPTLFAMSGTERRAVWERTWKTNSDAGNSCKVTLAIEERDPARVEVRVNSTVVLQTVVPWSTLLDSDPHMYSDLLRTPVVEPIRIAVGVWTRATAIQLQGTGRFATAPLVQAQKSLNRWAADREQVSLTDLSELSTSAY